MRQLPANLYVTKITTPSSLANLMQFVYIFAVVQTPTEEEPPKFCPPFLILTIYLTFLNLHEVVNENYLFIVD